jgi:adenylosuccinate synthase
MIGSTHQGTGPSAVARCARHSLHLYDIEAAMDGQYSLVLEKVAHTARETLSGRFDEDSEENRNYFKQVLDANIAAYKKIEEMIGPFSVDYTRYLAEDLRPNKNKALIEGCNGMLLDNIHGAQPHTTSASTNLGAMICGANFSPHEVVNCMIVTAAYTTCLGVRPFPTEMSEQESQHFFENCNETDVAEAVRRRIGWLDIPALRKALAGSIGATLHLNKLDVLSGLKSIKVCTHYLIDGKKLAYMPDDPQLVERVKPQYEVLPGWSESLAGIKEFRDLPKEAQAYVNKIEEWLGFNVTSLGTGPRNDDLIQVRVLA